MIQDYPPSRAPLWQLVGKEVAADAAAGVLFPLGLRDPRRRTPRVFRLVRQHLRAGVIGPSDGDVAA